MDLAFAELDFFRDGQDKLPIYLALRADFTALAPGCEVRVHKTSISFSAPRPFVYVGFPFRKNYKGWPDRHLVISFNADGPREHPQVVQSTFIRNKLYTIHAVVPYPGELDPELLGMVRFSLHYRNPSGGKT
ncbi:MAG: hypothetical protein GXY84_01650 [Clostridiales bacterium]|nr:hypothetical protein [Clostridiales bacterium]